MNHFPISATEEEKFIWDALMALFICLFILFFYHVLAASALLIFCAVLP